MDGQIFVKRFLPLFLCLVFFCLTAYINQTVFGGLPKSQDEVVYFFQAKTFSQTKLVQQSRPNFFEGYQYVYDDGQKRYGKYAPGWPLMLAAGLKLRIPHLVNPLLGSLNLLLIYVLGRRLYGQTVGQITQLLAFSSPLNAFISASYLSHVLCLFCFLVFLFYSLRSLESGAPKHSFFAALAAGYAFMTRPYTAAILVGVVSLTVWMGGYAKSRNPKALQLGVFTSTLGVMLVFFTAYNLVLTGEFKSTEQKYFEANHPARPHCNKLGFGHDRGCYPTYGSFGHSIRKAVKNTKENLFGLSKMVFGWSITSFLFLPFIIYEKRRHKINLLFMLCALALILGYSLYWNNGIYLGPRYYFEALPLLFLLSAEGINVFKKTLDRFMADKKQSMQVFSMLMLLLFTSSAVDTIPKLTREYGGDYWGSNSRIDAEACETLRERQGSFESAVVYLPERLWGCGFLSNSLSEDNVRYAKLNMAANRLYLKQEYPDKKCFTYAGGRVWDCKTYFSRESCASALAFGCS